MVHPECYDHDQRNDDADYQGQFSIGRSLVHSMGFDQTRASYKNVIFSPFVAMDVLRMYAFGHTRIIFAQ